MCVIISQATMGLLTNEQGASDGYTLFSNNKTTYLIDPCGLIVNTWESQYKPGKSMYLLEDGNLLRTGFIDGNTNAGGLGGAFELFTWEGELIWQYKIASVLEHGHHDIAPISNTKFLALVWESIPIDNVMAAGHLSPTDLWSEKIVEIDISAEVGSEVIWQWRLWDHLIQNVDDTKEHFGVISDHQEKINVNYGNPNLPMTEDWVHLNSIDYNPQLDQIIVSSRNFNEVWVIDHSTSTNEASSDEGGRSGKGGDILYRYGNPATYNMPAELTASFDGQHNAQWIDRGLLFGGRVMVFNNNYSIDQSSISIWETPWNESLEEYQLAAGSAYGPVEMVMSYTSADLYSDIMSSVQMLKNGNLFICEGRKGRFTEVTQEGNVVWEYINPVNGNGGPGIQGGTVRFNEVFSAHKYHHDYLAFDIRDLSPGNPVELLPLESDCFEPSNDSMATSSEVLITYDVEYGTIQIQASSFSNELGTIHLYSISGHEINSWRIMGTQATLEVSEIQAGLYILYLSDPIFKQVKKIMAYK